MMLMGCGGAGASPPLPTAYTIDATGLILSVTFDRLTTRVGTPTVTANGNAITLAYKDGSSTATVRYDITSGNPSGDPVLDDAVVLLSAAAGIWTAGGVGNAAVSGAIVTNNSAAWGPPLLTGLSSTILVAAARSQGKLWQDTGKTVPAAANGDPVRVATCPITAADYTAPSDAARPTLYDETGGKWSLSFDGVDDRLVRTASVASPTATGARARDPGALAANKVLAHGTNTALFAGSGGRWQTFAGAAGSGAIRGGGYESILWSLSGAASYLRVNATTTTAASQTNVTWTNVYVGCNSSGAEFFPSRVAGLVMATGTISGADADLLVAFLATLA